MKKLANVESESKKMLYNLRHYPYIPYNFFGKNKNPYNPYILATHGSIMWRILSFYRVRSE